MRRGKKDILATAEPKVPKFSTGHVASILGLDMWRLQRLLENPHYQLSVAGQLGKGRGSRRFFIDVDVYRIGIATFLIRDGFAPKFVAKILQEFDDYDLLHFDKEGSVHPGITLTRGEKGAVLGSFKSGHAPEIKPGSSMYYVLDLGEVIPDIDRRIATVMGKKGQEVRNGNISTQ